MREENRNQRAHPNWSFRFQSWHPLIIVLFYFSAFFQSALGANRDSTLESNYRLASAEHLALIEGYAALRDLAADEAQVDQVLIIRHASADVGGYLHDISSAAKRVQKTLNRFTDQDHAFSISSSGLPPLEVAARKLEAGETEKQILFGRKPDYLIELLISQIEGCGYGQHLLQALANHEKDPDRSNYLSTETKKWKILRQRGVELLLNLHN